jgi:hypothetical protein
VTKIHNEEKIITLITGVGKTGYPISKRMKLDIYLTPLTKTNSK